MTIIIFILVLLVCVIVHEWGHFIVAKKSGMLVEEFGFGIPPRLFSWKRGETTYSVNALPIGGFVKIAGENGEDASIPFNRQFESKPWYVRSLVLVAGVICNFLLAVILFATAYMIGLPGITETGTPTVITVVDGSPAEEAGLKIGDVILEVRPVSGGDMVGENIFPLNTETIHTAIISSSEDIQVTYIRDETPATVYILPTGTGLERKVGIGIEPIGTIKLSFFNAIAQSWTQSVSLTAKIFDAISTLVGSVFSGKGSTDGLIGPVGLAKEVGTAATFGIAYLFAFVATISLNLAVLNIMPFPALDGGRLIIVWAESITRRKFSPAVIGIVHLVGFAILIGLMILLTIGDIRKAL